MSVHQVIRKHSVGLAAGVSLGAVFSLVLVTAPYSIPLLASYGGFALQVATLLQQVAQIALFGESVVAMLATGVFWTGLMTSIGFSLDATLQALLVDEATPTVTGDIESVVHELAHLLNTTQSPDDVLAELSQTQIMHDGKLVQIGDLVTITPTASYLASAQQSNTSPQPMAPPPPPPPPPPSEKPKPLVFKKPAVAGHALAASAGQPTPTASIAAMISTGQFSLRKVSDDEKTSYQKRKQAVQKGEGELHDNSMESILLRAFAQRRTAFEEPADEEPEAIEPPEEAATEVIVCGAS